MVGKILPWTRSKSINLPRIHNLKQFCSKYCPSCPKLITELEHFTLNSWWLTATFPLLMNSITPESGRLNIVILKKRTKKQQVISDGHHLHCKGLFALRNKWWYQRFLCGQWFEVIFRIAEEAFFYKGKGVIGAQQADWKMARRTDKVICWCRFVAQNWLACWNQHRAAAVHCSPFGVQAFTIIYQWSWYSNSKNDR